MLTWGCSWKLLVLTTLGLYQVGQASSPVIGVLTEPGTFHGEEVYYVAASYVKWLEVGGARSIPIPFDASPELIDEIFPQINAFFLPGGGAAIPESVTYLLSLIESRKDEEFFPVWGTCLGFEFLLQYKASQDMPFVLTGGLEAENISLPLENVKSSESQLYRNERILDLVTGYNITMNNHHFGVTPDRFHSDPSLSSFFVATSTNRDRLGKSFVSTIEPVDPEKTPWYGVQYHPEKNAFEYSTYPGTNIPYEAIDHSEEGLELATYLARFFVNLARKSQRSTTLHAYKDHHDFPLVNTFPMRLGRGFEEYYVLPPASYWDYLFQDKTEESIEEVVSPKRSLRR